MVRHVRISEAITVEDWGPDVLGYIVSVHCEVCDRIAIQILALDQVVTNKEEAVSGGLIRAAQDLLSQGCPHIQRTLLKVSDVEEAQTQPCDS